MKFSLVSLVPSAIGVVAMFTVGDTWSGLMVSGVCFLVAIAMCFEEYRRDRRP